MRFIQLTDTHLFADDTKDLLGVKTHDSFNSIVQLLEKERGQFDFIIHSGDISQDHTPESYEHFAKALSTFQVPIYWVPGNHDDEALMQTIFPLGQVVNHKQILLNQWQIILLNSQKEGAVEGYFAEKELAWMKTCLQQYPSFTTIILFHHQPIPVGSLWLDKLGISNAREFWELAEQFPQIKYVLFGHVHQEFFTTIGQIKCYATPSTCIQFAAKVENFKLSPLPPAYRWVQLSAEGGFSTGVRRASAYIGKFNENATGY